MANKIVKAAFTAGNTGDLRRLGKFLKDQRVANPPPKQLEQRLTATTTFSPEYPTRAQKGGVDQRLDWVIYN